MKNKKCFGMHYCIVESIMIKIYKLQSLKEFDNEPQTLAGNAVPKGTSTA